MMRKITTIILWTLVALAIFSIWFVNYEPGHYCERNPLPFIPVCEPH